MAVLLAGKLTAQVVPVDVPLNFGFPDLSLKAVAMDASQHTLLATNHGLYTFNGNSLRALDVTGLNTDNISSLLLSGDTLWIGRITGEISRVDLPGAKIIDSFFISDVPIQKMIKANSTQVIAATAGAGVFWVKSEKEWHQIIDKLSDSYVNDLAFNSEKKLLAMATDRGVDLLKMDSEKPAIGEHKLVVTENDLYRSVSWSGDTLFFCGDNAGLNRFVSNGEIQKIPSGNSGVESKIFEGFGERWILNVEKGLCRIDYNGAENLCFMLPTQKELIDIFQLKEGYLIGWLSNGSYHLFPLNYSVYKQHSGVDLNHISAIISGTANDLWVAVKSELIQFELNAETGLALKQRLLLPGNANFPVVRLAVWQQKLLAGSLGDGLFVFDLGNSGQYVHYTEANGLSNNSILDLVLDENFLWISTLSGVQRLNLSDDANFTSLQGTPGYVYDLIVPKPGDLFASSQGESVFKLTNDGLIQMDTINHRDVSIVSMSKCSDNSIWGLSIDSELYQISDNRLTYWPFNSSISKLEAYEILPFNSTFPALISANALYLPNSDNSFFEAFWLEGIFNSEYQHIAVTDSLNNFWIASKNGLIMLDKRIAQSGNYPQMELQAVLANHLPASKLPEQIYKPFETDISLIISEPWYDPNRPIIHEYRLLGLDSTWRVAGNLELFFPKLAAGKYTLEVRSKFVNSGAVFNVFAHSFSIARPFYNRGWFYLLVALFVLLLVFVWVRYREKKSAMQFRAETERVQGQFEVLKNQINPHFLFNSFNTLAAMIGSDPVKAEEYTEKLSAFFRQILSVQQNDVVSLKRELELADDFIYLQRSRYGEALQYAVDVPNEYLQHKLPVLALQILLENAIKHNTISKAKPLSINISAKNNLLEIRNNIQPRHTPAESTGVGLTNLANRMQILFGKALIVEKTGDTFKVIIPL